MDISTGCWINPPQSYDVSAEELTLITEPHTDLWQRTYYGFRNDNAPAFLFNRDNNFTFSVKVAFTYKTRFDQCGVIIYCDSKNWFKASIEYENSAFSRLGSVVTNWGYSDWATTDIETKTEISYRLSRRGADFLMEYSLDSVAFQQMRIFHLHALGETTGEIGKQNPPTVPEISIRFGVYACSPLESAFQAKFSKMKIEPCVWLAHN